MKKSLMILVLFSILTSCSGVGESQPSPLHMITVDVPSGGGDGITFPTGTDDSGTATLTSSFRLGETEVTNKLVAEIFQWAYEQGYLVETVDAHNEVNTTAVKYGSQELYDMDGSYCRIHYYSEIFSIDEGYEKSPVVNISWYGAVIICNWLTEMKDGDTNNVVYYDIDETWTHTATSTYSTRTGYRLPTKNEWEYAARWYGTDTKGRSDLVSQNSNGGDASLDAGYYWTPGNYLSGSTTYYNDISDADSSDVEDGKEANDRVAVYGDYFNGTSSSWIPTGVSLVADVGSKGDSGTNSLGFYDMAGNVIEWASDISTDPTKRAAKDGSWDSWAFYSQTGYPRNYVPDLVNYGLGFRLARNP